MIDGDCQPHVQPLMKLVALERDPHVRFDWTAQKLRDVARWSNGYVWRKASFAEYYRYKHEVPDDRTIPLFEEKI